MIIMDKSFKEKWDLIEFGKIKRIFQNEICEVAILKTNYEIDQYCYVINLLRNNEKFEIPSFNLENLLIQKDESKIEIILNNSMLFDVFLNITYELHLKVVKSKNELSIINFTCDTIDKFLFLFKKKRTNKIEEIIGLYGELLFILSCLNNGINVIQNWFGNDGNRHDFSKDNTSIEIKSSVGNNNVIKVSNEYQLMNTPPENLFLIKFHFDIMRDNDTDSTNELINNIMNKIDNQQKILFINKLSNSKVDFNDNWTLPNSYKFDLLSSTFYNVDQSFPKLTKSDLLNGIEKVSYNIQMSSINEKNITSESIIWKHLK